MKIILIIAIVFLFSCRADPKESYQTGNFTVEFLFEHEGCKMYRFKDGGSRYVYWSDCRGKINADYSTSNGKSSQTVRSETIIDR